eukprot:gene17073-35356_t
MNEQLARDVVLVRAIETADAKHEVLSDDDRLYATRSARELAQWQAADSKAAVTDEHFLQQRSELLIKRLVERHPALGPVLSKRHGIGGLALAMPLLALLLGAGLDRIGDPHRVDLLSAPLLAIITIVSVGIAGVGGFAALTGLQPGLNLLANVPLSVLTDYNLSVIPMFILMGAFASQSGMSTELFAAGRAWLGHRRGGLALASIAACGGFSAINGSSVAAAATMAQVALPEMRRAGYSPGFSAGLIAAGGTLGIMIPPSVIMVLYGIMTETDITKLFAAGIIPGLMAVAFYCGVVAVVARLRPDAMPCGERHGWGELFASLRALWAVVVLFVFVLGGIYGGLFTVQEAAGVGAMGTLAIGMLRRRLGWEQIKGALIGALRVSSSIMLIGVGAS